MKCVVNKNDINEIADYIINNREKKQIKSFNNNHNVKQYIWNSNISIYVIILK